MEGSSNRLIRTTRTLVAGAFLAGLVALAGCGGGGGSSSNNAVPPPAAGGAAGSGGVVTASGTKGLVGPAERANSKSSQAADKAAEIAAGSNHVPRQHNGHAVAGAADCNGDIMPDGTNESALDAAIICLLNSIRQDNGLPALTENSQLESAAQGMGDLMVKEQFFDHVTPEGKNVIDRVQPTGYIPDSGDWVIGENLAWGNGALSTPNAIVNGWMNSPGHKANILAPDYKDIGLSTAQGSPSPSVSGGTVYVNDFGAKSGADTNATLPSESGATTSSTSGGNTSAAAATVAGTKTAKAKHKAKRKRRHKKKH